MSRSEQDGYGNHRGLCHDTTFLPHAVWHTAVVLSHKKQKKHRTRSLSDNTRHLCISSTCQALDGSKPCLLSPPLPKTTVSYFRLRSSPSSTRTITGRSRCREPFPWTRRRPTVSQNPNYPFAIIAKNSDPPCFDEMFKNHVETTSHHASHLGILRRLLINGFPCHFIPEVRRRRPPRSSVFLSLSLCGTLCIHHLYIKQALHE